jgi:hypothetical protein
MIEDLVPYIASGTIAVISLWLGKLWEQRGGTESWKRDRRLSAYSDLISTSHAFWQQVVDVCTDPKRSDRDKAAVLNEVAGQFNRDSMAVELLGPDEVARAAQDFRESIYPLATVAASGGDDDEDPLDKTPEALVFNEASWRFRIAAKEALRLIETSERRVGLRWPRRRSAHKSKRLESAIGAYADALLAKGVPAREVARAALFAESHGLEALAGPDDASEHTHVTFAKPTCGNWDCLHPEHQTLTRG